MSPRPGWAAASGGGGAALPGGSLPGLRGEPGLRGPCLELPGPRAVFVGPALSLLCSSLSLGLSLVSSVPRRPCRRVSRGGAFGLTVNAGKSQESKRSERGARRPAAVPWPGFLVGRLSARLSLFGSP